MTPPKLQAYCYSKRLIIVILWYYRGGNCVCLSLSLTLSYVVQMVFQMISSMLLNDGSLDPPDLAKSAVVGNQSEDVDLTTPVS